MPTHEDILKQARLLVERMEKVSVDSIWARRASGHRGALLKWIEKSENLSPAERKEVQLTGEELGQIHTILSACYKVMEKAAQERLR